MHLDFEVNLFLAPWLACIPGLGELDHSPKNGTGARGGWEWTMASRTPREKKKKKNAVTLGNIKMSKSRGLPWWFSG